MHFDKINSWAKINLTLNVIGRLPNKYHKIESLVSFVKLNDEIFIGVSNKKEHKITFSGRFSYGIGNKNTITELFQLLDKEKLIKNFKFRIKIKKNIPQKSGLGGGSMNAASILRYLIKKKVIKASNKKIQKIANKVGSDVALGLELKNSILLKNQKIKRISNKINLYVLIVKTNIGCSTKEIYAGVKKYSKSVLNNKNNTFFKIDNLIKSKNDLETVVFKKYPKINKLKFFLSKLPKAYFTRMTGSGSALVTYFKSKKSTIIATKIFRRKYNNYWYIISKTM